MFDTILYEIDNGRARITLNRPEKLNVMSLKMQAELSEALWDADARKDAHCAIIKGAGRAFTAGYGLAGGDQVPISRLQADNPDAPYRGGRSIDDDIWQLERAQRYRMAAFDMHKPVIAQVHGHCVGGGCAIALCADLRYAADDAVFAIPAGRLGLGYGASGIDLLVRTVGLPAAREIFFTARRFSADEALRAGLVNAVVPAAELDAHVKRVASGICANAPLTLRSAKLSFGAVGRPADPARESAISESIQRCYASEDYAEGVRAFLEKRRPDFKGR